LEATKQTIVSWRGAYMPEKVGCSVILSKKKMP